jgi:hypothetical protein
MEMYQKIMRVHDLSMVSNAHIIGLNCYKPYIDGGKLRDKALKRENIA